MVLDASDLPPISEPDEDTLRRRYEQEKARFVEPEQRLVSHILVPVEPGADAAAQQAAEEKARQIAAQAREPGADFAALARANPGDPGSAENGGDLGWIRQDGSMVKPFEDAAFAAAEGSISDPVRSEFGWHVLHVREVRSGHQAAFEEVRDTLVAEVVQAERERAFGDLVGAFVDQVYRNPTELASAARQANLEVHTAGPFARRGRRAGGHAGGPACGVLEPGQDGTASDPIEIDQDRSVVIRVTSHEPERALTVAGPGTRSWPRSAPIARKTVEADRRDLAQIAGGKTLRRWPTPGRCSCGHQGHAARARCPRRPRPKLFQGARARGGRVSTGKVVLRRCGRGVPVEKVTPGDPPRPGRTPDVPPADGRPARAQDADTLLRELRRQMGHGVRRSSGGGRPRPAQPRKARRAAALRVRAVAIGLVPVDPRHADDAAAIDTGDLTGDAKAGPSTGTRRRCPSSMVTVRRIGAGLDVTEVLRNPPMPAWRES